MSKFIMLVGLPASGKSTLAEKLSKQENAVILSSDKLREELLGDINNQDNNTNIFEEMNKRTKNYLESGQNVIYDATNINRKRRIHLIKNELKADEKHVYYMNVPMGKCLYNDGLRERKVGFDVIDRMYKNLQIPTILEGWDSVNFVSESYKLEKYYTDMFESILSNDDPEPEDLFNSLGKIIPEFNDVYDVPQDSKYHSFSISRHIFYTYKYILDKYKGNRELEMIVVALFHDLGKGYCKSFYNRNGDEQRYANFIGHEHVSSQLASEYLHMLGYEDDFIKYVIDLVQFHMKFINFGEKQERKLKEILSEEQYTDLLFLHEADINAK
jgi:predicted kinase